MAKDQDAPIKEDFRLKIYKEACEKIETFIKRHRRICWEAEFQDGEYALGDRSVKAFVEKLLWDQSYQHSLSQEANQRLRQQVEKYEKALEHYADERRWSAAMLEPGRWTIAKVQLHGGDNGYDLAQQVLDDKEK